MHMADFKSISLAVGLITLLASPALADEAPWSCKATGPAIAISGKPVPVDVPVWKATFDGQVALAKLWHPPVVFMGDSITEHWPQDIWQHYFGAAKALNFGISKDKIENVLWRFDQGGHEVWDAKAFVILIGTNNLSNGQSPRDVADGIRVLIQDIHARNPEAHIFLIKILPREFGENGFVKKIVDETNQYLSGCASIPNLQIVDLADTVSNADGIVNDGMQPDQLHPSPTGYAHMAPRLAALLAPYLKPQ